MRKKPDPEGLQSTGTSLTEATRVSLTMGTWVGLTVPLIAAAVSGALLWRDLKTEVRAAREEFSEAVKNSWTVPDQREFTHRMRAENVGKITVPSPDEVRRDVRTP